MQPITDLTNDPNTAVLLVVMGALGIYAEFCRPGLIAPGVLGSMCVLLGFASLAVSDPRIPIRWTTALVILAFAFLTVFLLSVAALARRNKLKS